MGKKVGIFYTYFRKAKIHNKILRKIYLNLDFISFKCQTLPFKKPVKIKLMQKMLLFIITYCIY